MSSDETDSAVLELAVSVIEHDSRRHKKEARRLGRTALVYAGVTGEVFAVSLSQHKVVGLCISGVGALAAGKFAYDAMNESRRSREAGDGAAALRNHVQESAISSDLE